MLNHQRSVWESATWPEPQTCQRLFSQLSGTGLQVPVAGNIPKHSSVSLAITRRSSSSVLRAIVLSKLMLRKKKKITAICACLYIGTCHLLYWVKILEFQLFLCKRLQYDPEYEGPLFMSIAKIRRSIETSSRNASSCLVWERSYLIKCLPFVLFCFLSFNNGMYMHLLADVFLHMQK